MTRYAIDPGTAVRIIRDSVAVGDDIQIVAPAILRSDVLGMLYAEVRAGTLDERAGLLQLDRLAEMKIRLLGDRVSRLRAWRLASRLGWKDTGAAEYLAVALLQADALIAEDESLRAAAAGIVPLASFDDLTR